MPRRPPTNVFALLFTELHMLGWDGRLCLGSHTALSYCMPHRTWVYICHRSRTVSFWLISVIRVSHEHAGHSRLHYGRDRADSRPVRALQMYTIRVRAPQQIGIPGLHTAFACSPRQPNFAGLMPFSSGCCHSGWLTGRFPCVLTATVSRSAFSPRARAAGSFSCTIQDLHHHLPL